MFLNKCPGTKGGDADDMNPNLPSYIPPGTCNGQQDLCSLVPGICDNSDDNDRDDGTSSSSEETPEDLLRRAGRNDKPTPNPYRAQIGHNLIAYIWVYYYFHGGDPTCMTLLSLDHRYSGDINSFNLSAVMVMMMARVLISYKSQIKIGHPLREHRPKSSMCLI